MADDALVVDGVAGIRRMLQIPSNSRHEVPIGFCEALRRALPLIRPRLLDMSE
jgi:hypothetical protein